ncbi:MAG TPA: Crp/Fnr family transcriptional regulator [Candidatus Acidoferrales bacterium]|nr:Crp/Fnr family transcriptional regulator [Candidatus Acidoferrales bacterium]
MDPTVQTAIDRSFLARLPEVALAQLLEGGAVEAVPAGTTTYRAGSEPRVSLIVGGLFRTFLVGPDGRQVTIRYARIGDVFGIATLFGGPAPLHGQALIDSVRLRLDRDRLLELARADTRVALTIAEELTATAHALWQEIAAAAFATVPQRVARHLLEIAARDQEADSATLVAHVSQQELADLAGSVREVVARALRELRDDGIVTVNRSGITVLDPSALAARAWPTTPRP